MDLVSVIVPVFNVENYVIRCIESLLVQSYEKLEIILIDDGSTDDSGKICDKYALADSRIVVIHQNNQGLSAARNIGISIMRGEYVSFVDSDDYVSPNYIESLYHVLDNEKADISICLGKKFYDDEKIDSEKIDFSQNIIFSSKSALESMLYRKEVNSYAWGKLYKSELFKQVRFPVGKLFEDVFTIYKVYDKADKIAFNPVRLYYYYQRSGSIVNSVFSTKKMQQVIASEQILFFVRKNYPEIESAAVSKYFVAAVDVFRRLPSGKQYNSERKYLKEVIRNNRRIVLVDRHNKWFTRLIAVMSYISINGLNRCGRIYQKLLEKRIIRIKNPI